ncbi:MAG: hypothetical protein AAGJ54_06095 [Planctomycetota bacterium]
MTGEKEAMLVQSEIVLESGAWVVYLEVWFDDGIQRKRIGDYRSEAKARIAARWITWAARREITPPMGF